MSDKTTWTDVDAYFADRLIDSDEALDRALRDSEKAGLPNIQVSPVMGQFLNLLVRFHGAKRILEIGTLGGYSTIWMARALPPGGRLISLEVSSQHAQVARLNIANAGLDNVAKVRIGAALDTLEQLFEDDPEPFDFFFIDADKANIPSYFEWAIKLGRPGAVIVVDNVVRDGAVLDHTSVDAAVQGVRRLSDMIARDRRVRATAIQTVGLKGYDGFLIARIDD